MDNQRVFDAEGKRRVTIKNSKSNLKSQATPGRRPGDVGTLSCPGTASRESPYDYMNRKIIIVIIAIIFVLGIAFGIFWWRRSGEDEVPPAPPVSEEEAEKAGRALEILSAVRAFDDQKVEGVVVVKEPDRKIIKNEAEGYVIETPKYLVIARSIESSAIHFYRPDEENNICGDPQCPALITIKTELNPDKLSLEEWSEMEEAEAGYPMFQEKEEFIIGGETAFRIKEETVRTAPIYYYFLAHGNKIYRISLGLLLEPGYREYLATFRFQ